MVPRCVILKVVATYAATEMLAIRLGAAPGAAKVATQASEDRPLRNVLLAVLQHAWVESGVRGGEVVVVDLEKGVTSVDHSTLDTLEPRQQGL